MLLVALFASVEVLVGYLAWFKLLPFLRGLGTQNLRAAGRRLAAQMDAFDEKELRIRRMRTKRISDLLEVVEGELAKARTVIDGDEMAVGPISPKGVIAAQMLRAIWLKEEV